MYIVHTRTRSCNNVIFCLFSDALLADLQNTISPPPPAPSGRITPNYNSLNGSLSRGDYATINSSSKYDKCNSSKSAKSPPTSVSRWSLRATTACTKVQVSVRASARQFVFVPGYARIGKKFEDAAVPTKSVTSYSRGLI